MSEGTGIYEVHSKAPHMPDLKLMRQRRRKHARDFRNKAVHSVCHGGTVSGPGVFVYHPSATASTPEDFERAANKRMRRYLYPSMTNDDLRALVQKFSIDLLQYGGGDASSDAVYDNEHGRARWGGISVTSAKPRVPLSGTQFVRLVGDRMKHNIVDYVRVNRGSEYMNTIMDAMPSLNEAYSSDGTSAPPGGFRPPRESNYETLVEYFLGWLRQLHGIVDIIPSLNIQCRVTVVGLHNKVEICRELASMGARGVGKCGDDGDGLLPAGAGDAVVLGPDGAPLYIDHTKMIQQLTSKVHVNEVYPSQKHHLTMFQLSALTVLMNYNNPPSFDNALAKYDKKIQSWRDPRFQIVVTVDNLNSLIHAFDVVDMDESSEFLLAVQRTCADKNITFNQELASPKVMMTKNKDNMTRFIQARVILGMYHLTVSDFYNLYVTDMRQLDTVSSVLTAYGCTNVWCLKVLESMLSMGLPKKYYKKNAKTKPFKDYTVFDNACRRVHAGIVRGGGHAVDTISVKKRFTLLALLQTYLDIEFDAAMQHLWIPFDDMHLFVWHALFFERPFKYGLLVERARSVVRDVMSTVETEGGNGVETADFHKRFVLAMSTNHSKLILLPLLLLLDAYTEYYKTMARGGDKNVFRFTNGPVGCNAPMLTDPKLQIEIYHSYLLSSVSIEPGDSYRTVTVRYLHHVFAPLRTHDTSGDSKGDGGDSVGGSPTLPPRQGSSQSSDAETVPQASTSSQGTSGAGTSSPKEKTPEPKPKTPEPQSKTPESPAKTAEPPSKKPTEFTAEELADAVTSATQALETVITIMNDSELAKQNDFTARVAKLREVGDKLDKYHKITQEDLDVIIHTRDALNKVDSDLADVAAKMAPFVARHEGDDTQSQQHKGSGEEPTPRQPTKEPEPVHTTPRKAPPPVALVDRSGSTNKEKDEKDSATVALMTEITTARKQLGVLRREMNKIVNDIAQNRYTQSAIPAANDKLASLRRKQQTLLDKLTILLRSRRNAQGVPEFGDVHSFHPPVFEYMLKLLRLMVERVCAGSSNDFTRKPAVLPVLLSQSHPVPVDSSTNNLRSNRCGAGMALCASST